jgi:hypothetical protein
MGVLWLKLCTQLINERFEQQQLAMQERQQQREVQQHPLFLSLPYLDANDLSLVCRLSRAWNADARHDVYWESIVLQRWPGSAALQAVRGDCFEFYCRRRRLEELDMFWPIQGAVPNPDRYSMLVELSIGQRLVHSSLLDLIVQDGYLIASPGQHFEQISCEEGDPEGIDSLRMSATLLRKEDNKLMRICNGVSFHDYDTGWVNFECFTVIAVPPCLAASFDHFQKLPSVRLCAIFRNPEWQDFAALNDVEFLCGFGSIAFRVTLGTGALNQVGRRGDGINDGGIAILRLWQNHGVWV